MKIALACALLLLVGGGCSIQRGETAAEAQTAMVGLSKEQVLACMGPPGNQQTVGATEVWSYASGGSTSSSTFGSASGQAQSFGSSTFGSIFGSSTTSTDRRYCIVDVVMTNGRVQRVNYQGNTGGLISGDEQCAYAVESCVEG